MVDKRLVCVVTQNSECRLRPNCTPDGRSRGFTGTTAHQSNFLILPIVRAWRFNIASDKARASH
jgi:hypothetical protein